MFCCFTISALLNHVNHDPENATLYLDSMQSFLKTCSDYFLDIKADYLKSQGDESARNLKTLKDLQERAK